MTLKNKRGYARNYNGSPIIFSNFNSDRYCNAFMRNFSVDGMHFISDNALRPGSNISIEFIDQSLNVKNTSPIKVVVQAKVIWCKKVADESGYGIGVRFYKTMKQYSPVISRKEQ